MNICETRIRSIEIDTKSILEYILDCVWNCMKNGRCLAKRASSFHFEHRRKERERLVLMQVKGRRKMDSPDATTKTVTLVPQ